MQNEISLPPELNYVEFNDELIDAYNSVVNERKNVLITGSGGVGKSVFIEILKKTDSAYTVFLAPTGVASVRIGGQTIHSFFQLPPTLLKTEDLKVNEDKREMMQDIKRIVIDEIFMVRADMLDAINSLLQLYRFSNEPFGGVQMVFVGDLYQLPPIIKKDSDEGKYLEDVYTEPYFFNAFVYKYDCNFKNIEFTKIYRQADAEYKEILNRIRKGLQNEKDLFLLNRRLTTKEAIEAIDKDYVYIAPFNKIVDNINREALNKLPGFTNYFPYRYYSDPNYMSKEKLEKIFGSYFNVPKVLELKVGAKVMFTVNNIPNWINGTIGYIEEFGEDDKYIRVNIKGTSFMVEPIIMEKKEYFYKKNKDSEDSSNLRLQTVAKIAQFPLKVAYALSIHKSQSATFDAGFIDLGNYVFAEGMTYVALSRFKDINKVGLKRAIRNSDIKVNLGSAKFLGDEEVLFKYGGKNENK